MKGIFSHCSVDWIYETYQNCVCDWQHYKKLVEIRPFALTQHDQGEKITKDTKNPDHNE